MKAEKPVLPRISPKHAQRFADAWFAAWNAHDLDAILGHYADDIAFTSPFVTALNGDPTGTVRGKDALRAYFGRALAAYPDLCFTPTHTLSSVTSVTLVYRSVRNLLAAETMLFDSDGGVSRVYAHYSESHSCDGDSRMPDTINHPTDSARIRDALNALKSGDYSVRFPADHPGIAGEIATAFNDLAAQWETFAREFNRIALEIGAKGMFGGQGEVPQAQGTLQELTENLNRMSANLTTQLRLICRYAESAAGGDTSRPLPANAPGEMQHLRDAVSRLAEAPAGAA